MPKNKKKIKKKQVKTTLIFDKDGKLWLKQGKKLRKINFQKGYTLKKLIKKLMKKFNLKKLYVKRPKKPTQVATAKNDITSFASGGTGYTIALVEGAKREAQNEINNLKADQNRTVADLQKQIQNLKDDIGNYDLDEQAPNGKDDAAAKAEPTGKDKPKAKGNTLEEQIKEQKLNVKKLISLAKKLGSKLRATDFKDLKKPGIINHLKEIGATAQDVRDIDKPKEEPTKPKKPEKDDGKLDSKHSKPKQEIVPKKVMTEESDSEYKDNEREKRRNKILKKKRSKENKKKIEKVGRKGLDNDEDEDDVSRHGSSTDAYSTADELNRLGEASKNIDKKLKEEKGKLMLALVNRSIGMIEKQVGKGYFTGSGTYVSSSVLKESKNAPALFNDQIDEAMKQFPEFKGAIARNQIDEVLKLVKPQSRVCWIQNFDKTGEKGSHWVACYVDARPKGSLSAEYYDSFGRRCPDDILKGIKEVVKKMDSPKYLKFKENRVTFQNTKTENCGYFSIMFLVDRLHGIPFPDATKYNKIESEQGEKHLALFKEQFRPFSYI